MSFNDPSSPQLEPASLALEHILGSTQPFALLEDRLGDGGARLLHQHRCTLQADSSAALASTLDAIEASTRAGAWVLLAARYEMGLALEPRLHSLLPAAHGPLLQAWVFDAALELANDGDTAALLGHALAQLSPDARCAGIGELSAALDADAHATRVARIKSLIHAGDCYQVNLTFALRAQSYGHPLALYAQLRERQPVRHAVFLRHEAGHVLSLSPELFVARSGKRLTTRPMKGTAPRGHARLLAQSAKDLAENLMIVDLLRNDLGRLAPAGGVRVEDLFQIEDYPTLHQMTSTIIAEPVEASLRATLQALFPCGSVTGAPKVRAMQIINEVEEAARGLYCGALGALRPDGDFSFNVPIRTLEIDTSGALRMSVGSGIVADSQAAGEYRECLAKGGFLSGLEKPFSLFETLRQEADGSGIRLRARHLARLQQSAHTLGFRYDAAQAAALLDALPPVASAQRLRLTLSADGALTLSQTPLDPLPAQPSITLAQAALDAGDWLLQHKTSRRARYDAALAQSQADGHFDQLFFNQHDELCEGARSNVVLRLHGRLYTPPLRCGLLPGVMRAELIASGQVQEQRLGRADVLAAEAILLCNALRGLFEVKLLQG